ncbi:hypothetical protein JCM10207_001504 [Rhodosporidiobolus poonsookiae]
MPVTTRASRKSTSMIMNQSFDLFSAAGQAPAKTAFDEASAADLAAFLDLSSFDAGSALVVPEFGAPAPSAFTNAFSAPAASAALRPVDDSLLDSPLGLELSPASSFAPSSVHGSPFDFASVAGDYTSPLLTSYDGSPLVDCLPASSLADLPSLFAPAPAVSMPMQWAPSDAAAFVVPTSPAMEDVKPVITPTLTRLDSGLFDFAPPAASPVLDLASMIDFAEAPAPAPVQPASSTPAKRKTAAQLKKEAAALIEEKPFKKDKFTGIRNTKKPMVDYDAPTLPKNYLTESATSRKRGGAASSSGSSAKRARTASNTPAPAQVELPSTAAEPIDADDLNEDQLTAIEAKRRQNTLAARRSRMRKAAHIAELNATIDSQKTLIEALQAEVARLKQAAGEA